MLTVTSGAFHPSLEQAFLTHLKNLKSDPLARVAVVAPSGRQMERLQLLCGHENLSFLNVHFHTFTSLAQEVVNQAGGLKKTLLSDSHFFDTLVKFILKNDRPFQGLADLALPQGFPPAVRGTLRDLIDAGVPSDGPALLEAVKEDFLGRNVDLGTLLELLRLYKIYAERIEALPILPRSALLTAAIEAAPDSSVLKPFKEILYYGFYDLTGLQADFFKAVVQHHPAHLFFPYVPSHPSYSFASRFRDTFLQPLIHKEQTRADQPYTPSVSFFNTSGLYDEAWVVANEILRLHEEEGIPFSEMAVVSRAQDRLKMALPPVLLDRAIPFQTAAKEKLGRSPLVESALLFLRQGELNPTLPENASWQEMEAAVGKALETFFHPDSSATQMLWEKMLDGLNALTSFDLIQASVTREEFLETLSERWMKIEIPAPSSSPQGVSLLYAEATRGLSFKVVFLIGVEEKVFPRILREDPFLRDDARFALFQTLGYKIHQKLTALEEERLLFEMLTSSAQAHLYLTYQRSDEDGKVIGPSPFLRAFAEEKELNLDEVAQSIPRPTLEKIRRATPRFIGKRDIVMGFLSKGQNTAALQFAKKVEPHVKSLKTGLEAAKKIDSFGKPTPFDGLLPPQNLTDLFPSKKLSATPFETYGRCPFQFFATRLLELAPLDEEGKEFEIPADQRGTLVHEFFEKYYKAKPKEEAFPKKLFNQIFDEVFSKATSLPGSVLPFLWEVEKEALKIELERFLEEDHQSNLAEGYEPKFFEQDMVATLDPPLDELPWYGRLDRMDLGDGRARIVDYKTGRISAQPLKSALKGFKVQPPIYILLAEKFLEKANVAVPAVSFLYHKLGGDQPTSELTYEAWVSHKKELVDTVKTQMDLMKAGHFLIAPDEGTAEKYCHWCDVKTICRKNHGPSSARASEGSHSYWDIRAKKPERVS